MSSISLLAGRNNFVSKTKYRFEVVYCPDYMQRAVKWMNHLDVDMEGTGLQTVIEFSSSKDLAIDEVKKNLISAFESEKCKVMRIEGGKIE